MSLWLRSSRHLLAHVSCGSMIELF